MERLSQKRLDKIDDLLELKPKRNPAIVQEVYHTEKSLMYVPASSEQPQNIPASKQQTAELESLKEAIKSFIARVKGKPNESNIVNANKVYFSDFQDYNALKIRFEHALIIPPKDCCQCQNGVKEEENAKAQINQMDRGHGQGQG